MMEHEHRGTFGSRLGIILASAGSAVGLGNIWRFPTEVGRHGGAAFILVYFAFVMFLAFPVMVSEFVIGRRSGANTVGAYRRLAPGKPWVVTGLLGVLGGFMVLSFYSVVAGWTLHYTIQSLAGHLTGEHDFGAIFTDFTSNAWMPLLYVVVFLLLTHLIVARGVESGIERFSKVMMPLLFVIILVLIVCSVTMPGASRGIAYLLKPDFSQVTPQVVLSAMGQAFFSLSVGIGCLVTYASYFGPRVRLMNSALNVCLIDTMVAVLSGFIIFPAVFSVGLEPGAGPGLVFITLPQVFNSAFAAMPLVGYVFSGLFYTLLLLAALTSSISMHEISTAFIRENYHMSRSRAAMVVTGVCGFFGIICALSFGPLNGIHIMGMTVFDLFDYVTAKFVMPLGGILIACFVGWYMDRDAVRQELTNHGALAVRSYGLFVLLVRWVAPVGVAIVFVNELLNA